ncbi:hypothetical protein CR163_001940 [Prosthecochloris sp. ZM_2]|nr:hypothetical protein CR163_001940 [Prosthecochloris sp. ZM_2]
MSLRTFIRRSKRKGVHYDVHSRLKYHTALSRLKRSSPRGRMSFSDRWKALRNWGYTGYLFNRYYAGCSGVPSPEYVPENFYKWHVLPALNPKSVSRHVGEKAMLDELFPGHSPTFLTRHAGVWRSGGESTDDARARSILCGHLGSPVVVKKSDSARGNDIHFFSAGDEQRIFDAIDCREDLCIQHAIVQHPLMSAYHSASVNTVRLLTFSFRGDIRLLGSFARFGVGGANVDNLHAGGIMVKLDGCGRSTGDGYDLELRAHAAHPDSGRPFRSLEVHCWQQLQDTAMELHRHVAEVGIIGWDFAIGADRNWLLECNTEHPSLFVVQFQSPPVFSDLLPDMYEAVTGKRFVI